MKYIKKFESKKNITEDEFTEFSDTLQNEIFDEYGIVYLSDDDYDSYHENESNYKYWEFSYDEKGNMRQINICKLSKEDASKIQRNLEEIKPIIRGRVGVEYSVKLCNDEKYDNEREYYLVIFPEK